MPGDPSNRRAASLTRSAPIEVELLWHRFEVHVDDAPARDALQAIRLGAVQDLDPQITCVLEVVGAPGTYRVHDNGDLLATAPSTNEVVGIVLERMQRRAFELAALKSWLRIHGAVLTIGDRRVAAIGASGSGKTTLSVAALAAGHQVEADESFLFAGGVAIAVPRRFHIEHGTFDLVPEARSWAVDAPMLSTDPPVVALDPSEVGHGWHTRSGPLDAVVIIGTGPDHDLRALDTSTALPLLMSQALPTIETRAAVASHIAGLLRTTPVHAIGGRHRLDPQALLEVLAGVPVHR
ncbi:MAG: hypothetical protein U5K29_02015 [Acidimicrobiales bacterium]|nr:hypothetical protein [Acidimicrobiales bacterium]